MGIDADVQSGADLRDSGIRVIKETTKADPAVQELDASKLEITRRSADDLRAVPEPDSAELWSSHACTDHMVTVRWTESTGWQAPAIVPYGPLTMLPTASCLHYATQCFEGMKVYRGYDGRARLFRPNRNCARLVVSAMRAALPSFDAIELEKIIKSLLAIDCGRWLPKSRPGTSLYIRPALIGDGEKISLASPSEVLLFIIAVPWPDLASGTPPGAVPKPPGLKLLASKGDIRAWPGGFGFAKVGANYGPAFVSHMAGRKKGYDQILWLLNDKREYEITEAGASNFFVVWRAREQDGGGLELVTAPLDSKIILDGVTRRSVLELARERLAAGSSYLNQHLESVRVVERTLTMIEVEEAVHEGRLVEAFLSGTAYFIAAVSAISFREQDLPVPMAAGNMGHYATKIKSWLTDIMYGRVNHPWGVFVDEE